MNKLPLIKLIFGHFYCVLRINNIVIVSFISSIMLSKMKFCLILILSFLDNLISIHAILYKNFDDKLGNRFNLDPESGPEFKPELISSNLKLCLKPGCIIAASELIQNIDKTVNPCDNFYQFSCGGWIKRNFIADDKHYIDVNTQTQDKINNQLVELLKIKLKERNNNEPKYYQLLRNTYTTCMNTDKINQQESKPLLKVLRTFGGWPVVDGKSWDSEKFDLFKILMKMRETGYSSNKLIDLKVDYDVRNLSQNAVYLKTPSHKMKENFLNGFNDSLVQIYYKLMIASAKHLGADQFSVESDIKKVINFEIKLANLAARAKHNDTCLKVEELTKYFPQIKWKEYFNHMIVGSVQNDEVIGVESTKYLIQLNELLSGTDKRILANYMMWGIVLDSVNYLDKQWNQIAHDYNLAMNKTHVDAPRWRFCYDYIFKHLPVALSAFYVQNESLKGIKEKAVEIATNIKNEFISSLDTVDWMDKETANSAKEKAKAMKGIVGYSEDLLNNDLVDNYHEKLFLDEDSFFNNTEKLNKWSYDLKLNKTKNVSKENYDTKPVVDTEPFYFSMDNVFIIPSGMLKGYYFNPNRPNFINYATLGLFVGHEMTHGFDNKGRLHDKDGRLRDWWSKSSSQEFKERAQCFVEQYSEYTLPETGDHLNGAFTLGENIADNVGYRVAFKAYQKWVQNNGEENLLPGLPYTAEQLFWISLANTWCEKVPQELLQWFNVKDEHSDRRFRVIGPLSNYEDFHKSFNCSPGSVMNPIKKCKLW